jgi:hypothetical protein
MLRRLLAHIDRTVFRPVGAPPLPLRGRKVTMTHDHLFTER